MEYSLMTLKVMADHGESNLITAREISEKLKIPYDNVAKALQKFTKIGIVTSEQGVKGGYRLIGDLSKVTLHQILEAVEGPVGLVKCKSGTPACDIAKNCTILNPADRLNALLVDMLRSQSIAKFFGLPGSSDGDAGSRNFAVWR